MSVELELKLISLRKHVSLIYVSFQIVVMAILTYYEQESTNIGTFKGKDRK